MGIIELKAATKWSEIKKNIQKELIDNAFCSKCGVTTIEDYSIKLHDQGLILTGKCKTCDKLVARIVENV